MVWYSTVWCLIPLHYTMSDETVAASVNALAGSNGSTGSGSTQYGQAEILAHIVRRNRRFKIARRSAAYQQLREQTSEYTNDDQSLTSEAQRAKSKADYEQLKAQPVTGRRRSVSEEAGYAVLYCFLPPYVS